MKTTTEAVPICTPITLHDRRPSDEYYQKYRMGRRDIAMAQFQDRRTGAHLANFFYQVSGRHQLDLGEGVIATAEDIKELKDIGAARCQAAFPTGYEQGHKTYFDQLDSRP